MQTVGSTRNKEFIKEQEQVREQYGLTTIIILTGLIQEGVGIERVGDYASLILVFQIVQDQIQVQEQHIKELYGWMENLGILT
jgi:hypothetical protein